MPDVLKAGEIPVDAALAATLEVRLREAVHKASGSRDAHDVAAVQEILDLKAAEFRSALSHKIRRVKSAA